MNRSDKINSSSDDAQQNQMLINDIIRRRISEVLRTNPNLNKRVSHELNVALAGTAIDQGGIDTATRIRHNSTIMENSTVTGNKQKRELLAEATLYRIIFSNPDLKAEFESLSSSGRLGEIPPLEPPTIVKAIFNIKREQKNRLVNTRFIQMYFCLALLLFMFAFMAPATVWIVILFCITAPSALLLSVVINCSARRRFNNDIKDGRVCCTCGLSTKALRQHRDHEVAIGDSHHHSDYESETTGSGIAGRILDHQLCTNCNGTAVCQVGCRDCCPFIVPRDDAIRRADIQRAVNSDHELKTRFDRKIEDSTLELLWESDAGAPLTHQKKTMLILKAVDSDPALRKDIERAVARLDDDDTHDPVAAEDALSAVLSGASFRNEADGVPSCGTFQFEMELPIVHAHAVVAELAAPHAVIAIASPNQNQTVAEIV